jgi:hypothetical protein
VAESFVFDKNVKSEHPFSKFDFSPTYLRNYLCLGRVQKASDPS